MYDRYADCNKSKKAASWIEIAIMHQPSLATLSSNTFSQTHVQIKHFLAHVYMYVATRLILIPTLAGVVT